MKYFSFLIHFIFIWLASAQATAGDTLSIPGWDHSPVEYRRVAEADVEAYANLEEYQYDHIQSPISFWDRFLNWLASFFPEGTFSGSWVRYLFFALFACGVVYFILRVLNIPVYGLLRFSRKTVKADLKFAEVTEDIYDDRLEQTLEQYINSGAYREAVRLLYLLCLRHLEENNNIVWQRFKTNKDYYYELSNEAVKLQFKDLVRDYECAWYGHFSLSQQMFNSINERFKLFFKSIK